MRRQRFWIIRREDQAYPYRRTWELGPVGAFVLGVLIAALIVFVAPRAFASEAPPGQEECTHGNSEIPCRPDPQPDHGQECEDHGKDPFGPDPDGVNEDHCLAPEPPTPPPSSPPVEPTPPPPACVGLDGDVCRPAPPSPSAPPASTLPSQPHAPGVRTPLASTGVVGTLALFGGGILLLGFLLILLPLFRMDAAKNR